MLNWCLIFGSYICTIYIQYIYSTDVGYTICIYILYVYKYLPRVKIEPSTEDLAEADSLALAPNELTIDIGTTKLGTACILV